MKWWNERGGTEFGSFGIKAIVDMGYCDLLKRPSKISVKKDGKYDRIVNYDFSIPVSTLADMEDITF